MALAFDDDDASPDGPTFEAHALPSSDAGLAGLSLGQGDAGGSAATVSVVPPPADVAAPRQEDTRSGGDWRSAVGLVLGFAAAFAAAALLASYAR
jgi:hypothetical protein